jgi:hypothetical protein
MGYGQLKNLVWSVVVGAMFSNRGHPMDQSFPCRKVNKRQMCQWSERVLSTGSTIKGNQESLHKRVCRTCPLSQQQLEQHYNIAKHVE